MWCYSKPHLKPKEAEYTPIPEGLVALFATFAAGDPAKGSKGEQVCVHIYVVCYVSSSIHAYTCKCMYMNIYEYIYINIRIYTHMYIYTFILSIYTHLGTFLNSLVCLKNHPNSLD